MEFVHNVVDSLETYPCVDAKPKDRYNMDFLSGQDMDYRQKSLIDVNPETGDVDYRRLNPVKPIQNPPQKSPDVTRNVFQSYHHNPNMQFNPQSRHNIDCF
jgi:hypothetical protein